MKDQYGRTIEYLRVSVTDRCNLRCVYCMPREGVKQVSHKDILSYDEIVKLCRLCAGMGISKFKLTGGEPLVRRGLHALVGSLKQTEGIEQVTLTTNGVLLAEQLDALVQSGLDAVNISLDTLDKGQYLELTGRNDLDKALKGLEAALSSPSLKVKVNCVALGGVNEDQWVPLARLAKDTRTDVRFIEMMPIGLGREFPGKTQEEVCQVLEEAFGEPVFLSGRFGNGPAVYASFQGFQGKIGFISAVSHQFCADCNRVRLTAEGFLKPCLQYSMGADLKSLLRGGAREEELEKAIKNIIFEKPRCHQFVSGESTQEGEEVSGGELEEKEMSRIGG